VTGKWKKSRALLARAQGSLAGGVSSPFRKKFPLPLALRSVPSAVAGLSSASVINPNAPGGITPGSFTTVFFDPNFPDTRAADWNFTLEREVMSNTVVRASYVGTHGWNLEQDHLMNQAPNAYIRYSTTGQPLPTGTFASTAMRNLNQTTYGDLEEYGKYGWSNSNSLQLQMERRYSKGYAYQFFYVLDNAFRAGGDGWHDDIVTDPNTFLPGAVPSGFTARDRALFYQRDTAIPKHHVRWNWLVDLPVGKGKKFGSDAGPWLNRRMAARGLRDLEKQLLVVAHLELWDVRGRRCLRHKVPDPGLPQRTVHSGLSLLERLSAGESDQHSQRGRSVHREMRCAVELHTLEHTGDPVSGDSDSRRSECALLRRQHRKCAIEKRRAPTHNHQYQSQPVAKSVRRRSGHVWSRCVYL